MEEIEVMAQDDSELPDPTDRCRYHYGIGALQSVLERVRIVNSCDGFSPEMSD